MSRRAISYWCGVDLADQEFILLANADRHVPAAALLSDAAWMNTES